MMHPAIVILATCVLTYLKFVILRKRQLRLPTVPVSVNYHFTRKCNATCSFCFHTEKTSFVLPEPEALRGLALLKRAGMRKINFAGGEPFLYPSLLGNMLKYCKEELDLESVSIVSNGSKIRRDFLRDHQNHIDILAVSCDSFNRQTNVKIGRMDHGKDYDNVETLARIAGWCEEFGIRFKLNSVICRHNVHEDMAQHVENLNPFRWKVFQVLMVPGENDSADTLRNANALRITDDEFEDFCARHKHLECFVPESNLLMKSSYLILDEYMHFLDKDKELTSDSILEVGVEEALSQVHWDEAAFQERGGLYDWGRGVASTTECGSGIDADKLDW